MSNNPAPAEQLIDANDALEIEAQDHQYRFGPEQALNTTQEVLGSGDRDHATWFRSVQVYSSVYANYMAGAPTITDQDNPLSLYNQIAANGMQWVLAGTILIPFGITAAVCHYKVKHERRRNSYNYLGEHMHKMDMHPDASLDPNDEPFSADNIQAEFNSFLKRKKITIYKNSLFYTPEEFAATKEAIAAKQNEKITVKKSWGYAKQFFFSSLDAINFTAMVFWPTWMTAVFIIGIAAATSASGLGPIMLATYGITLGLFAAYKIAKNHFAKKLTTLANQKNMTLDQLMDAGQEQKRIVSELKQRYFMKKEHALFNNNLEKMLASKGYTPAQIKAFIDSPRAEKKRLALLQAPKEDDTTFKALKGPEDLIVLVQTKKQENAVNPNYKAPDKAALLNSKLANHLLGSKSYRRAKSSVTIAIELINKFTFIMFALWLFTSTLGALVPFAAGIAGFLAVFDTSIVAISISTVAGGLFSLFKIKDVIQGNKSQEENLYARLAEEYKDEGISKHEKFQQLESEVENSRKAIFAEQLRLKRQVSGLSKAEQAIIATALSTKKLTPTQNANLQHLYNLNRFSAKDLMVLKYNLKETDVHNDYYFEKQKHTPANTTWLKKAVRRSVSFIGSMQTGFFVTRMWFLAGAVGAGLLLLFPTPLIGFVVMLGIIGLVAASLNVAKYQFDAEAKHKEFFLDTIDARISFLHKKDKELKLLSGLDDFLANKPGQVQDQGDLLPAEKEDNVVAITPVLKENNDKVTPPPSYEESIALGRNSVFSVESKNISTDQPLNASQRMQIKSS